MANSVTTMGFADSTELLGNPEGLRARAEEDGFLFFKALVPRELVLELRRQFLQVVDNWGWLDRRFDLMEGVVDRDAVEREDPLEMVNQGVGFHNRAYAEVQKLELFHEIAHHPNVLNMYRALLGGEILPHPRHIARLILPASYNRPTPPHQDFIHIQGTKNVWTMWMPVGDCPREMGNLAMIRGSNRDGLLPVAAAEGAGGLEAHLCAQNYEWVVDDYEAGDVITFSSLTVHKALKPEVLDRIRLSCDYRYQRADEEIDAGSLLPHGQVATWDEIYKGWTNKGIQYYWKNKDLSLSEWDESIRWQKEKIC